MIMTCTKCVFPVIMFTKWYRPEKLYSKIMLLSLSLVNIVWQSSYMTGQSLFNILQICSKHAYKDQ